MPRREYEVTIEAKYTPAHIKLHLLSGRVGCDVEDGRLSVDSVLRKVGPSR
jgi:hypothetical protein